MQTRNLNNQPESSRKPTPRDRRLANRASRHATRRELSATRNIRYTLVLDGGR